MNKKEYMDKTARKMEKAMGLEANSIVPCEAKDVAYKSEIHCQVTVWNDGGLKVTIPETDELLHEKAVWLALVAMKIDSSDSRVDELIKNIKGE